MLRSAIRLIGLNVLATDGPLGRLVDLYFDDHTWRVRYLVVGLEDAAGAREVLLSPFAAGPPDWAAQAIPVGLTVEQVKGSPDVETDLPVSRVQEASLASYYAWAPWWDMAVPLAGGAGVMYPIPATGADISAAPGDPHLRSVEEVSTYAVRASDGKVGRVEDFIVQPEEWVIRYIVARTRKWLPGRRILISPAWLKRVDWDRRLVQVNLARADIRNGPEFDPMGLTDRERAEQLYEQYVRRPCRVQDPAGGDDSRGNRA